MRWVRAVLVLTGALIRNDANALAELAAEDWAGTEPGDWVVESRWVRTFAVSAGIGVRLW